MNKCDTFLRIVKIVFQLMFIIYNNTQRVILLGEIGYMNHMILFGTIKNQGFINIVKS